MLVAGQREADAHTDAKKNWNNKSDGVKNMIRKEKLFFPLSSIMVIIPSRYEHCDCVVRSSRSKTTTDITTTGDPRRLRLRGWADIIARPSVWARKFRETNMKGRPEEEETKWVREWDRGRVKMREMSHLIKIPSLVQLWGFLCELWIAGY